ncbi:P-type conjugative transfer protein TrbJ [Rhizobium daejeonense]|uniref:P-type conjugative transfer protein TrbJ n=1 Tax=Rhizobium daejeonense TaxID=240521 RepID=A0A6M1RYE4_9HYPH|nr:P-type conjugative transfer protein TrbJ [Rhizobium daejeonense]NGO66632.1 P-type conjugative transfer protein TrbJ [Rhizobium daejeonense]
MREPVPFRWGRRVIAGSTAVLYVTASLPSFAGAATGNATEWTQLLNNSELISLVGKSAEQIDNQITQITLLAEQIQNQLNIYRNMLQNTARLPSHIWGQVESDLNRLRDLVDQGEGIAFSMSNADDLLKQRFKSYADLQSAVTTGSDLAASYANWSDTNRGTIAGTLRAASLTAEQFDTEEDTMGELRAMSQSADGQMQALQVGHQIAAQQVAQMQKLRALVAQQMTMTGTWFQSAQADKDLAQARRQQFFSSNAPATSGGKKMEIEW